EKIDWFIRNTADALAGHAEGSLVEHEIEEVQAVSRDTTERVTAIPYSVFEEKGEMRGWGEDKIKAKWKETILDKSIKKIKYKGQVCISRFEGILFDAKKSNTTSTKLKTKKEIKTLQELEDAKAKAQEVLSQASSSHQAFLDSAMSEITQAPVAIPDDLIENLADFDDFAKSIDDHSRMIEDEINREERRQDALDALLAQDTMEASIYMAQQGEEKQSDGDISKYRVSRASEFVKCKELFQFTSRQLVADVNEVVAAAKEKIGSDNENATEAFAILANAPKQCENVSKELCDAIEELRAAFNREATTKGMKEHLESLKKQRIDKNKAFQGILRSISTLRSLIKNKEMGDLRGAQANPEEEKATGEVHVPAHEKIRTRYINHALEKDDQWDRSRPRFVNDTALKDTLEALKVVDILAKWLASQLGGKDAASAMLDKPKHYEDITKAICSVLQDPSLEKPFSVLHSCLPSIFALGMQCSSAKFVNVGFNPFGLGQWTIVLKGGLLLVCVQGEHVEGKSYAEKVSKLMEASPDSMHNMVTEHGFFMHCTAGAAAWVPPGFFCMCISLGDATWLK
ncbi:unnamed protein product, partial [Prorocentrum cordatum]